MSTIRNVAQLAGVSTATVSRVLNNDSTYKMRDETYDKVWRAVAESGYRAKARKTGIKAVSRPLSGSVGCILSVTRDKYRDPYFMSIFSGVEERLAEKGLTLAFLKTHHELQEIDIRSKIFTEPPAGLILMETLEPELYQCVRSQVPVCVGVETLHKDIDNVDYDKFETALGTTEFLISRGHREIAFIGSGGTWGDIRKSRRFLGFFAAAQKAGLSVDPAWICDCQWDELICMEQVKKLMSGAKRPTAVYAASDLMAMAAMSALYSMGIKVPDEVAVIGLTNIEIVKFSSPPLTTYEIPAREMGQAAVDLLEMRFRDRSMLPRRVIFPTKLILRASV